MALSQCAPELETAEPEPEPESETTQPEPEPEASEPQSEAEPSLSRMAPAEPVEPAAAGAQIEEECLLWLCFHCPVTSGSAMRTRLRGACGHAFNMYWRRHHCRHCGKLFCGNCAEARHAFSVPGTPRGEELLRVCAARASLLLGKGGVHQQKVQKHLPR